MDEHLVAPDGGEQTDLRGADYRAGPDRDVTGLHVVTDLADVVAGADGPVDLDAGAAAVGPVERKHGVCQRRERSPRVDAHRLPWLQPNRLTRPRADLADDGQRQFDAFVVLVAHVRARLGHVDAADGVTIYRGLVESGQWALGDHLFGAEQTLRLRDGDPYRPRRDCRGSHPGLLILNRAHLALPLSGHIGPVSPGPIRTG